MMNLKKVLSALMALSLVYTAYGNFDIIKDGKGLADIVIDEKPPRSVKLAAAELQDNLLKMTGVKLPISKKPGEDVKAHIYVGRSADTDRLGITHEGLKHGAFKMVSGPDWLVLLGNDSNLVFKGPELRGRDDMPRVMGEWDKATGEKWEYPYSQIWKGYNKELDINEKDQTGSLNAVYHFLHLQGMRWYLPDPIGEITPRMTTVSITDVNKTVSPDFALRYLYQIGRRFGQTGREEVLWQLRLGLNQAPDVTGYGYIAHGMSFLLSREEVKKEHPEYYALIGGVRQNGAKFRPCLSSEGLFQANVKFVRSVFDIFDAPMVSVMPTDGFTSICQCDLCKDKGTPERGWEGAFSDYVWDYVDRVAKEVYKTHPNKKIVATAYTTYALPPKKISTFSPNIVVCIAQGRSVFQQDAGARKRCEDLRRGYLEKMPGVEKPICQYEYYRWAVPGKGYQYMPVFFLHGAAADIHSLKDISFGDCAEVYRANGLETMGVTHLNLYVTARSLWDADQDVNALLEEYYTLYYGPARNEMKAFIEYSEENFKDMKKNAGKIDKALELFAEAYQKVPADSIYAKRMAMIGDYMKPLKALQEQLSKGRDKENLPKLRARILEWKDLKMDGQLDDTFWKGVTGNGSGLLKDLKTGKAPAPDSQTSFKVAWADGNLYFGIKCMDPDMEHLKIGATKNEENSIWNGDSIEILIETQAHSYYQITIGPNGVMTDLDRENGLNTLWSSDAEVASYIGDKFWSLEVRIPVADELQANIDDLNGVSGRKPDETYPWHFNVCRQRIRGTVTEASAFSPSEKGFHDKMKFAELSSR